MDYDLVRSKKSIKRAESTKSNPWWWDSHIGLKNSKWLENNLDEMDRSVKRMVKLIEEDADSFAKKAEMYYQKRPELISLVDEFHRMYRSLAERYENITGELRKSSPSELQSQSSGLSDISASDLTAVWTSNDLNRLGRPPSGRRAPGFDYFLGNGGLPSDLYHKDGDDSASITDSELESDDSSVTNYPGYVSIGSDFQSLSKRIMDLEIELREAKERLRMQLEGNTEGLLPRVESKFIDFPAKLAACEQELRDANDKLQNSEDQICMLKSQLARYLPSELDDEQCEGAASTQELDIETLSEELRITNLRLREAEKQNGIMRKEVEKSKIDDAKLKSLQDMLESAQKEAMAWKSKSSADRREVVKLLDRISMLKSSLAGRDHEIRDLKTAVSDAEEKIFPEKAQVKAEISKLLEEKRHHDDQFKELEAQVRYLEDEIRKVFGAYCVTRLVNHEETAESAISLAGTVSHEETAESAISLAGTVSHEETAESAISPAGTVTHQTVKNEVTRPNRPSKTPHYDVSLTRTVKPCEHSGCLSLTRTVSCLSFSHSVRPAFPQHDPSLG